ncbi:hypothetical protein MTO96_032716 [Rhipicephalus appendiculatus]
MDVHVRPSSSSSGRGACAKVCVLISSVVIGIIGVCAVFLMAYKDSRFLMHAGHSLRKANRAGARGGPGVSIAGSDNCTNKLCLPEAGYLLSRLNLSVGQCDDFYRFVCSDRWFEHESQELPFRFSSVQHVYDTLQRYAKDGLLHLINDEKLVTSSALVQNADVR